MVKRLPAWLSLSLVLVCVGLYSILTWKFAVSTHPLSLLWAEDGWLTLSARDKSIQAVFSKTTGASRGELLYGAVREEDLPWFSAPPVDLNDLRTKYQAYLFISGFRTTLPDPILQEEFNVGLAAMYLAGTVIMPSATFSLNQAIGPRTKERGFGPGPLYLNGQVSTTTGGGICKVATTMYNVGIYADLHLVERHPHSMLVPYVPPGRDATIVWGQKDLRFLNNKDHPLVIWAAIEQTTLYIALYGAYDPPRVEWHSEETGRVPTWTIRRRNPRLAPGEVRTLAGSEGMSVKTWITVDYPDEPAIERYLGMDYYKPLPNYVDYGP